MVCRSTSSRKSMRGVRGRAVRRVRVPLPPGRRRPAPGYGTGSDQGQMHPRRPGNPALLRKQRRGGLLQLDWKAIGKVPIGGGWRVHGRTETVWGRGRLPLRFLPSMTTQLAFAGLLPAEKGRSASGPWPTPLVHGRKAAPRDRQRTGVLPVRGLRQLIADPSAKHRRTQLRRRCRKGRAERFNAPQERLDPQGRL